MTLRCLLWVISGHSGLYHPNGRFWVGSGRLALSFPKRRTERPLFPKADAQTRENKVF